MIAEFNIDIHNQNQNSTRQVGFFELRNDVFVTNSFKNFIVKSSWSVYYYRHFIINSNRNISANEVFIVAGLVFKNSQYKVKKIVKPLFNYI